VEHLEKLRDKLLAKARKLRKEQPDLPMDISLEELVGLENGSFKELEDEIAKGHNYVFIGKVGLFAPIKKGHGGGLLMREKGGNFYAVGGSSGYRWMEAESVCSNLQDLVDMRYFYELADGAIEAIREYGDFDDFVSDSPCSTAGLPWDHTPKCGESSYENCLDCPHWRIKLDGENFEESFSCDKM